ncbi:MAG TPA: ABC transporter ATP-binding protein [Acidimicrobiales bacterium]|nr:ABC transporter ATP-binding protein [Acidimicrobiales bacterium]
MAATVELGEAHERGRTGDAVISVEGLRMEYGGRVAVDGIDLSVQRGEIFALLGPNGAGKTSTVEILEGYRRRTGGRVRVLGQDPQTAGPAWRDRVGVVLQSSTPEPELSVAETLRLYAGLHYRPLPVAEVMELVGLGPSADVRNARLSGGQQRRLDFALALIGDPDLVFLDEPTTGFDPGARRAAWDVIAGLRQLGKTVLLTTHYLEEAEVLADRMAVMAGGRVVACGPPALLGGRGEEPTELRFVTEPAIRPRLLPADISRRADVQGTKLIVRSHDPLRDLHLVCGWLLDNGIAAHSVEVRRRSLEDIYLDLTGGGHR